MTALGSRAHQIRIVRPEGLNARFQVYPEHLGTRVVDMDAYLQEYRAEMVDTANAAARQMGIQPEETSALALGVAVSLTRAAVGQIAV